MRVQARYPEEVRQCAACSHDADAETTNPMRLLEDPGGAMDGDKRRPDRPTEPPDMPEGARW